MLFTAEVKRKAWNRLSPGAFRENMALETPWFQTSSLRAVREYTSVALSPLVCVLGCDSHRKLIAVSMYIQYLNLMGYTHCLYLHKYLQLLGKVNIEYKSHPQDHNII